MPYVSTESILHAKQMDLLTYLQNYEPEELVYEGQNEYSTKSHDSLKISNGKWCWFSQGFGGKTALDYLIKVKGMSFVDAVVLLEGNAAVAPPKLVRQEFIPKEKNLLLPNKSQSNERVKTYLIKRGISENLIDFCIKTGRIYESLPYHSAVFVGFDKSGTPRYAAIRSTTDTPYKGDANGSDKHYSFSIPACTQNPSVHIFESAIDALSYATIQEMNGIDWRQDNLLSLAGIYQPKRDIAESKLPSALVRYFEDNPHISGVVLHLDNDIYGRLAAQAIMTVLPKEYSTINAPAPGVKDYNDYVCMIKGLSQTARKNERNKAR